MRWSGSQILLALCVHWTLSVSTSRAIAKSAEECNAEYAARNGVIKAAHGTKAAYLAACRAGKTPDAAAEAPVVPPEAPAPTATPAAPTAAPFGTPAAAPFGTPVAPATAPIEAEEPSQETNVSVTAPSGTLTKIDAYFTLKPDCSSVGYADIGLKTDAKNGSFSAKKGNDRPAFPSNSSMAKCNRKYVPSSQLYYQSTKGYIGDDKVSVKITLATGDEKNVTYNITVK